MSCRHFQLAALLLAVVYFACPMAQAASWDAGGGANRSWGNSLNWTGDSIPLPGDDVLFTDLGAANVPGTTTSILDAPYTIGGLSFQNSSTKFQTVDLGGFALQENGNLSVNSNILSNTLTTIQNGTLNMGSPGSPVDLSVGLHTLNSNTGLSASLDLSHVTVNANLRNLIVGEKILGGSGTASGTLTFGNQGSMTIGSAANPGQILVGVSSAGGANAVGNVDLGQMPTLTANVSQILVGAGDGSFATGTLKLAATNNINAGLIHVGSATSEFVSVASSITLGMNNTIVTPDLSVGGRYSGSSVTIPVGGALSLGSVATPTNLTIGRTDANTNFSLASSMNLSGASFNANLSSLTVGERLGTSGNGATTATLFGGTSGAITIGTVASPGNITVGHISVSGVGASAAGTVDFSGQTSLTANVLNMNIGTADGGVASGVMNLAANNNITANSIVVGANTSANQTQVSTLALGGSNTINTPAMTIGGRYASGALTIPALGSLNLGTPAAPTNLIVGRTDANTDTSFSSTMNLSGATFNATLSNLTVSERLGTGGNGTSTGTLTGGNSGAITIGAPATPGNLTVGHIAISGVGGKANGTVDFSGQTSLTANLNNLLVGTSEGGAASGVLKLAATNNIVANNIVVGNNSNDIPTQLSSLSLGQTNTILSPSMTIGGRYTSGNLSIPAGGSLALGSVATPTNLIVGRTDLNTDTSFGSNMNLSGAAFTANLSNLTVSERLGTGGNGTSTATLTGGNTGAITIGTPEAPGKVSIGHIAISGVGAKANGTVDFSGQSSVTANLSALLLGAAEGGFATGKLTLAPTNNITAGTIRVGYSTIESQTPASSLSLGLANTIATPELIVGGRLSAGQLDIPVGGSLALGSDATPTNLSVGRTEVGTTISLTSTMNLTGAAFNGTLSNLTVGDRSGGPAGTTTASLLGGNSGAIKIGSEGQLGNVAIGRVADFGTVNATVNLSGQNSLTAWLDHLDIGVGNAGSARGALTLAKANTIHVNSIVVGANAASDQSGVSTLTLGLQQSIYAHSIAVGGQHSMGSVSIVNGGLLNLGTPDGRVDLSIGRNTANSSLAATSTFDLTGGVTQAFLGNVIIGEKSGGGAGTGVGVFTTGATNNQIDATSIVLGQGTGNGTFNFNGGSLTAQSIAKGTGTAAFNWSAGTLHVQTFGAPATPFNLVNNGVGVLDPGAALAAGLTTIQGSYTQASLAGLQIDLGGALPGTGYDQVAISNVANLAGTLNVDLIGGFEPTLNQKFTVMIFGSRVGDFGNYSGLDLGAAILHPSYVGNTLVLQALAALNGDVNLDGIVDIQDMTVIANNWLSPGPAGDANNDGIVDIQDMTVAANHWLDQLGGGAGASAQAVTAVPEPSTYAISLLGVLCLFAVRRCQRAVATTI